MTVIGNVVKSMALRMRVVSAIDMGSQRKRKATKAISKVGW